VRANFTRSEVGSHTPSVDAVLAAFARRQHGLVTGAQLAQAGLGYAAVSKRVANGRLHRRHRGVYAVGHPRLSQEGLWMAAVLGAGEGAVLSHLSAAVLWKIWRRRVQGIDVVAARERRLMGVRVHRARRLDPRDATVRDGIPVTTVARTQVDLTDVLTPEQLANVIHEAAFRNLYDARATEAAIQRANGRRHLASLQAAVRAHATGSAGTKSNLEDRFLAAVHQAGLPAPRINTRVQDLEVDFHWPERNLCVEIDGTGHERPRTRAEDRARDRALKAAGQTVIRLHPHELEPATIQARLAS
jgi:very-short-patch-repair endonuclease